MYRKWSDLTKEEKNIMLNSISSISIESGKSIIKFIDFPLSIEGFYDHKTDMIIIDDSAEFFMKRKNFIKRKEGKMEYIYLVERISDGVRFCTVGNFKQAWNRPCAVIPFIKDDYPYAIKTPFGTISNVSTERYDTKKFKVLYQVRRK